MSEPTPPVYPPPGTTGGTRGGRPGPAPHDAARDPHEPQAPHGSPAPPTFAYSGTGTSASTFPGSTAVLLLVSVASIVAVGIIGIPSAVIAVLAWRQHALDPVGAARRTSTGWVTYGVNLVVGALLLVPFYLWAIRR